MLQKAFSPVETQVQPRNPLLDAENLIVPARRTKAKKLVQSKSLPSKSTFGAKDSDCDEDDVSDSTSVQTNMSEPALEYKPSLLEMAHQPVLTEGSALKSQVAALLLGM